MQNIRLHINNQKLQCIYVWRIETFCAMCPAPSVEADARKSAPTTNTEICFTMRLMTVPASNFLLVMGKNEPELVLFFIQKIILNLPSYTLSDHR
jgi:hypothetical protein